MTGAVPNSLIGPRRVIGSSSVLVHPPSRDTRSFAQLPCLASRKGGSPQAPLNTGLAMERGFWAAMMPYTLRHQVHRGEGVCDEREKAAVQSRLAGHRAGITSTRANQLTNKCLLPAASIFIHPSPPTTTHSVGTTEPLAKSPNHRAGKFP